MLIHSTIVNSQVVQIVQVFTIQSLEIIDYQMVLRINEENPNGEWATNSQLLQIVQQVAAGIQVSGVTSTSSQGQSLAQNMITNYCLVQKPSDSGKQ
jgi:hypothetical protein